MQAMLSWVLLVAAFAVVLAAAGFLAVRLWRVSSPAGAPRPGAPEPPDA